MMVNSYKPTVLDELALNCMIWRGNSSDGNFPKEVAKDILTHRNGTHSGYCTNIPEPCFRCNAELAYKQAEQILTILLKRGMY